MNKNEYLLEYLGRGWTVIPVRPNSKKPLVSWSEYQNKKPTDDELAKWFDGTDNGIAVLTGPSNLVVVDLDSYKGGVDVESFEKLYPTNLRATSPNGGRHLYYDARGLNLKSTQGVLGEHIDTRSAGGYVIVAPTKIDGSEYVWDELGSPAPLPNAMLELLEKPKEVEIVVSESDAIMDSTDLLTQVIMRGFTPGRHNVELRRLAQLTHRVMNTDSDQLKNDFLWRLLGALDAKDPSPQNASGSFVPTVKSAIQYERDRIAGIVKEDNELSVISLSDFFSKWDGYETTFLIEEWLPEASILYISAPPESWKTWMLLDAAISVGLDRGKPFLNSFAITPHLPVRKKNPVLVFQQEDHPGQVKKRMELIMTNKIRDVPFNFYEYYETATGDHCLIIDTPQTAPIFVHERAALDFTRPGVFDKLQSLIEEHGAKLVCIDPLYSLAPADQYFSQLALALKHIKRIRAETGCAFLFAHHNKKSANFSSGRSGAYGSVLLDAAMEGAWIVESSDKQTIKVQKSGKFFEDRNTYTIKFDVSGKDNRYNPTIFRGVINETEELIIKMFQEDPEVPASDLAEALDISRSTVYRSINNLVDSGRVVKDGKRHVVQHQSD